MILEFHNVDIMTSPPSKLKTKGLKFKEGKWSTKGHKTNKRGSGIQVQVSLVLKSFFFIYSYN